MRTRRWLAVGLFGLALALTLSAVAVTSAAAAGAATASDGPGLDVRVPQSADDHAALAGLYAKVAAQDRERAAALRRSLADDLQRTSRFPSKTGVERPSVVRIRREAQARIEEAQSAAAEAERFAAYHRMRAKELEGLEFAHVTSCLASDAVHKCDL